MGNGSVLQKEHPTEHGKGPRRPLKEEKSPGTHSELHDFEDGAYIFLEDEEKGSYTNTIFLAQFPLLFVVVVFSVLNLLATEQYLHLWSMLSSKSMSNSSE